MKLLFTMYFLAREEYNKTGDKEWRTISNNHYARIKEMLQNSMVKGYRKYLVVLDDGNNDLTFGISIAMRDSRNIKKRLKEELNDKYGLITKVYKVK